MTSDLHFVVVVECTLNENRVNPTTGGWSPFAAYAERSFRRLKRHADMPDLVAAIARAINPATPDNYNQAAA